MFWKQYLISLIFAMEKMSNRRERSRSLLLFPQMSIDTQINFIEQRVSELLADAPGYFLVETKINAGSNIKVFIDADNGASIDKLVQLNRALYKQIDGTGLFPDNNFSLEVSSPGIDEPLKLHRQYVKNKGRNIEIIEADGSRKEGKLLEVTEDGIVLEEEKGKGKKKEILTHSILFNNIKSAKIQIKF
ncbi:MAG: ribosome maturation factor [Chitinophagaceae bacterium]